MHFNLSMDGGRQGMLYYLAVTWLADGFTTARDFFDSGLMDGPFLATGMISQLLQTNPAHAAQITDANIIKKLKPKTDAEIRVAVEEAATRDAYVAAHIYQDAHVKRALNLGVMSRNS